MHFNKDKTLRHEVTFVSNSDISLSIIEPATNNKEQGPLPVPVSLRAVFSKYSVTPARGMNFGPTTCNTTSKPKTFEITNLGEFSFDFKCVFEVQGGHRMVEANRCQPGGGRGATMCTTFKLKDL